MHLTFSGIKTELGRMLTDVPQSYFVSGALDTLLQNWIDDFASRTKLLRETRTVVVPSGSGELVLGDADILASNISSSCHIMSIEAVEWNYQTVANPRFEFIPDVSSYEEYRARLAGRENSTVSNPDFWYVDKVLGTPSGSSGSLVTTGQVIKLYLAPRPSDTTNARLRVRYQRSHVRIVELTAATSYPEFTRECSQAALYYCASALYERDDKEQLASKYWNLYMSEVVDAGGKYTPKKLARPRFSPIKRAAFQWARRGWQR